MVNNRWLAKQVWWVVTGWNWSCADDMLYKEDTQVRLDQWWSTSLKKVRPWVNPLHTHSPNTHNKYKHKTAYADGFLSEWQIFTYILTKLQNVQMLTVLKFLRTEKGQPFFLSSARGAVLPYLSPLKLSVRYSTTAMEIWLAHGHH